MQSILELLATAQWFCCSLIHFRKREMQQLERRDSCQCTILSDHHCCSIHCFHLSQHTLRHSLWHEKFLVSLDLHQRSKACAKTIQGLAAQTFMSLSIHFMVLQQVLSQELWNLSLKSLVEGTRIFETQNLEYLTSNTGNPSIAMPTSELRY